MYATARTRFTHGRAGFSLLEMMIVAALMFLVLGALCAAWQVGLKSWEAAESRTMLQQELRKGGMYMTGDLMQCGTATITGCPADNNWYSTISFRKATGVTNGQTVWSDDVITYALGGIDNQQVIRTEAGAQKVVANKVVTFRLRRHPASPTILEMLLGAREAAATPNQQCQSMESVTKIRLRN